MVAHVRSYRPVPERRRLGRVSEPVFEIFDVDGDQLRVWRGGDGWHVSLEGLRAEARFLDSALEQVLGRPPHLRLVLEILQWDAAPHTLH